MEITECLLFILMLVGILFLMLTQSKCNHTKPRGGNDEDVFALFIRFGETMIPIEVPLMATARDVLIKLKAMDKKIRLPPNRLFHFGEQLPLPLDVPLIDLDVSYEDTLSLQRYVSWTPSSNEELREAIDNYNKMDIYHPGEDRDIRY